MTGVRWTPEQIEGVRNRLSRPARNESHAGRATGVVDRMTLEARGDPIPLRGTVSERQAPRAPTPNKTEQRYIDEVLWPGMHAGELVEWRFEAVNLRLGPQCHYRPDFLVVLPDGSMRFDEIKGGWAEEDALVKFKTAVHSFPWFRWRLCRYAKKQWTVEVWR